MFFRLSIIRSRSKEIQNHTILQWEQKKNMRKAEIIERKKNKAGPTKKKEMKANGIMYRDIRPQYL